MSDQGFIEAFEAGCRDMDVKSEPEPARLLSGNVEVSTGRAVLDDERSLGFFQPDSGISIELPIDDPHLVLLNTNEVIELFDVVHCPTGSGNHLHLATGIFWL